MGNLIDWLEDITAFIAVCALIGCVGFLMILFVGVPV